MVEFLKDFLRCDRYAVLSSSKLPINDKIKRRAQAENSAALALRRSLRAQTAMAQTANVPKVSMIDLTKQKKKRKRRKSKHKPEAMDNLSDIEHEQDMEEIRSQVLLSQRAAAQRDLDQINEIKKLREQLKSAQSSTLVPVPVPSTRGRKSTTSAPIMQTSSESVEVAPHSISVQQTNNQQFIPQISLTLLSPQPQTQIPGHFQAPPPYGHYPQATPMYGHYPQATPPYGHYPQAPPPYGQQYHQGMSCHCISFKITSSPLLSAKYFKTAPMDTDISHLLVLEINAK